jgi:xanthine dehydrogenase YagS FAD-binding subunit
MNRFAFVNSTSVEDALAQIRPAAVFKAGGADLLDRMKQGLEAPELVVGLSNIASLKGVRDEEDGVVLGPMTTLTEIAEHPLLRIRYTALSDAASSTATPQVRNLATIGGNLLQRSCCWYYRSNDFRCLKKGGDQCFALNGLNQYHAIFDNRVCPVVTASTMAVALHAFNATVELTSSEAKRVVPVRDLYISPERDVRRETVMATNELLTSIQVPHPAAETLSAYQMYGEKVSFDRAIADAAVVLEMRGDHCRRAVIVMGAASPTPRRATEAEKILEGKPITEKLARAAGKAAMAGAVALSRNGYKLELFPVAIYRTILLAAGVTGRDPNTVG